MQQIIVGRIAESVGDDLSFSEEQQQDWPAQESFVSQKDEIRALLKSPTGALRLGKRALQLSSWRYTFPHTRPGNLYRRMRARLRKVNR